MEIKKSTEVARLLESRGITDNELNEVLKDAEQMDQGKFYHEETGRYAASKKIGEAVYWVLYSPADSGYEVHSAYWYKSTLT
jgi:hypothetical protein